MSPFEFMDRYRVMILLFCALGLVGFGAVGFIGGGGSRPEDLDEVIAEFELGGHTEKITREQYYRVPVPRGARDVEADAAARISYIIRGRMLESLGFHVSESEFKDALDKQIVEFIRQQNDGQFDKEMYTRFANAFGMQPSDFEATFRNDLRMAKMAREIDRSVGDLSVEEIYESFKKTFAEIKLKGVFFSRDVVIDQVRLATEGKDGDEKLTAESLEKLREWWQGLTEERKTQAPFKQPAKMSADMVGVSFVGLTDDAFDAKFTAVDPVSQKSLEQLTADFQPDEAVEAKLRIRLGQFREAYGLLLGTDSAAEYEVKKLRLVREWKIWRLVKKLHEEISTSQAAGKEVDLAALAAANNMTFHQFKGIDLEGLRTHEEFPGNYPFQLQGVEDNKLMTTRYSVAPISPYFDVGPADEVGRHASLWILRDKDLAPVPLLSDVLDVAASTYAEEEADKILEEAMKGFEDRISAILDEKVKDFAAGVNKATAEAIANETSDLDPEKDKDQIAEIKRSQEADAKDRIDDEKEKHRAEAYGVAVGEMEKSLADGGKIPAVVVEEGFFHPQEIWYEQPPEKEKSSFEEQARYSLRREFNALHDQPHTDKFVDVGTVSDRVASPRIAGLHGTALLVEKHEPSLEEMFNSPSRMRRAEFDALNEHVRPRTPGTPDEGIWSYENLKTGSFKLRADIIDEGIATERERQRVQEEGIRKREEQMKERLQKKLEAAQKALDDAKKAAEEDKKGTEGDKNPPPPGNGNK